MDTHGGKNLRIFFGQPDRRLAGNLIDTGIEDAVNASLPGAVDDIRPVSVKCIQVQVAVCVSYMCGNR